jgi:hypothetical protein
MDKTLLYCIIAFIAGVLVGIGPFMLVAEPAMIEELMITEGTAAIGALNETNIDQQLYSYSFVLYNGKGQTVHIDDVGPVFRKDISGRLLAAGTPINVNKTMHPNSSILVEGQIVFDATGLTKEEILEYMPLIDHVEVRSTEIILYP